VTPRPTLQQATRSIKEELRQRLEELNRMGRLLEAQRLEQRTQFDLEMIEGHGRLQRHRELLAIPHGRRPGEPPPTLFEYLPDNAIVFTDESHVTIRDWRNVSGGGFPLAFPGYRFFLDLGDLFLRRKAPLREIGRAFAPAPPAWTTVRFPYRGVGRAASGPPDCPWGGWMSANSRWCEDTMARCEGGVRGEAAGLERGEGGGGGRIISSGGGSCGRASYYRPS
jgi:hypothetical protein